MRYYELFETTVISHRDRDVPVFRLRNPQQLTDLIERYDQLRGIVFPDRIDVWEAHYATHNDYVKSLGQIPDDSFEILITNDFIDISTYSNNSDSDEFFNLPIIKKVFPKIKRYRFPTSFQY